MLPVSIEPSGMILLNILHVAKLKLIFWYKNNNLDFAYNCTHNNQILVRNQFTPSPPPGVRDWSPPCSSTLIIYPPRKRYFRNIDKLSSQGPAALVSHFTDCPNQDAWMIDGNSEQVAHAWRKKIFAEKIFRRKSNLISDCSRSNQMP